jgi:hypothetical protein
LESFVGQGSVYCTGRCYSGVTVMLQWCYSGTHFFDGVVGQGILCCTRRRESREQGTENRKHKTENREPFFLRVSLGKGVCAARLDAVVALMTKPALSNNPYCSWMSQRKRRKHIRTRKEVVIVYEGYGRVTTVRRHCYECVIMTLQGCYDALREC